MMMMAMMMMMRIVKVCEASDSAFFSVEHE